MTPDPADQVKRASLRRMKAVALGLLVLAAVVYVVVTVAGPDGWLGYVQAGAEAAMIGALADWFAVTALFRHPLGIPIPHTAIIPKRKDQIGASLGEFVESNFLTHEILAERIAGANVGMRLGGWLSQPAHAATTAEIAADALRGTLEVLDDDEVQAGLERIIRARIDETPVAPLVGKVIDLTVAGGHHQRLLDATLKSLAGFLDENQNTFRERLSQESPWWVPEPIDDRIFKKIYSAVQRFIDDVGSDPEHELRDSLDKRVAAFGARLKTDPELLVKGEQLKRELLEHPDVRDWIETLWLGTKARLIEMSDDPTSELRFRMVRSYQRFGDRLLAEPELRAKVDGWIERGVGYVVENYRSEVSRLISSTVERWDGAETADKMELQVGRDLQFIRINGTVVGGLAGLAIHLFTELL
jgi:uncharacterized membrane-anchored protein YjiN (DUF445 family)